MATVSTWPSCCAWCLASSFSAGGVSLASVTACLNFVPAPVWSVTIRLAKALILSFLVLVKATLLLSISNRLATAVLVRNVEVDGVAVAGTAACLAGGSAAKAAGALASISGNADQVRSRKIVRVMVVLP